MVVSRLHYQAWQGLLSNPDHIRATHLRFQGWTRAINMVAGRGPAAKPQLTALPAQPATRGTKKRPAEAMEAGEGSGAQDPTPLLAETISAAATQPAPQPLSRAPPLAVPPVPAAPPATAAPQAAQAPLVPQVAPQPAQHPVPSALAQPAAPAAQPQSEQPPAPPASTAQGQQLDQLAQLLA